MASNNENGINQILPEDKKLRKEHARYALAMKGGGSGLRFLDANNRKDKSWKMSN